MAPRTLHERRNSGITVRLDWDDEDNALAVTAEDRQNPEQSIRFRVEDPADAMTAFHHPFSYTARGHRADKTGTRSGLAGVW